MKTHAVPVRARAHQTQDLSRPASRVVATSRTAGARAAVREALAPAIRPKLVVGRRDDPAEAEADRVADRVLRMPDHQTLRRQAGEEEEELQTLRRRPQAEEEEEEQLQTLRRQPEQEEEEILTLRRQTEEQKEEEAEEPIRRQAEAEEEESEALQRQPEGVEEEEELQTLRRQPAAGEDAAQPDLETLEEEENQAAAVAGGEEIPAEEPEPWPPPEKGELEDLEQLRPKAAAGAVGAPAVSSQVASRVASPPPGRPMPERVRNFMEPRFGADFSDVRVHDSMPDRAMARSINARAFTYRDHVWIGPGASASDPRLMAHELTHVVQQQPAIRAKWRDRAETTAVGPSGTVQPKVRRAFFGFGDDLNEYAQQVPGYRLLTVVIGYNPLLERRVERNAANLLGGLFALVPGGGAWFDRLRESGAVDRAFTWVRERIAGLNVTRGRISALLRTAWDRIGIFDGIEANVRRVRDTFAPLVNSIIAFGRQLVGKVVEFILDAVMARFGPLGRRVMGVIRRAGAAFRLILDDPVRFIGHLVEAVRRGFRRFGDNILAHLRNGLMGWLFGALRGAGLQLPQQFNLRGILSIVLQVLGLTYQNVRRRLVRVLGEQRVAHIERALEVVRVLVTEGLPGIWQRLVQYIGSLRDMVIGQIRDFVVTRIVTAAVTRLVSMFNPAGAIVQAVIAVYNTVRFFIERIQQIAALAESVFSSIETIARGNVTAAATFVEQSMARTLPVIISFLARLLGLGGISERIRTIIRRIQAPINRALDRVVGVIVRRARGLLGRARGAAARGAQAVLGMFRRRFRMGGVNHELTMAGRSGGATVMMSSPGVGPLKQKIDAAIAGTSNPAALGELRELRRRAEEIETLLSGTPNDRAQRSARGKLADLGVRIQAFGARHGMTDLLPPFDAENELRVGTYGQLRGSGQDMTPDHEPQNSVMRLLKALYVRGENGSRRVYSAETMIRGYSTSRGVSLNMLRARHLETRTYGPAGARTKQEAVSALGIEDPAARRKVMRGVNTVEAAREKVRRTMGAALEADFRQVRAIYGDPKWRLPSSVSSRVNTVLGSVRNQNRSAWPNVF